MEKITSPLSKRQSVAVRLLWINNKVLSATNHQFKALLETVQRWTIFSTSLSRFHFGGGKYLYENTSA